MNKQLPNSVRVLFSRWEGLFEGDKCLQYIDWVKTFVKNHPDYPINKDYFTSRGFRASYVKSMRLAKKF